MKAVRFFETLGVAVAWKQRLGTEDLNLKEFMNPDERRNRITEHRVPRNLSTLYCAEIELPNIVCYITSVLYTVPK